MISWSSVPALRLALALATGIAVAAQLGAHPRGLLLVGAAVTGLAALLWPLSLRWRSPVRGAAVLLLTFALGLGRYAAQHTASRVDTATEARSTEAEAPRQFVATLLTSPQGTGDWLRADARLERVHDSPAGWTPTQGTARLMLAATYRDSALGTGSRIVSRARLAAPRPPLNPHTFDYAAYLAQQGIYQQAFVRAGEARVLGAPARGSPIARLRAYISARLAATFPTAAEVGVANALLLGDKTMLDPTVRAAYVQTGAVHVLAVSGLHTGIIAGVIVFLLRGLRGRARTLQLLLLWAGLAGYVALTGYAPSVMRSAVMFGILFAGRLLRLDANGFNSLGLSAVVLLAAAPELLFTLGFQLSYLAVAGILAFYPTLHRTLRSRYAALNAVADLVAVSVAATLATLPLTVYTFHQFPVYFAVSGCFAVPLVALALPTLLVGLCVDAGAQGLGFAQGYALYPGYALIWVLDHALAALGNLPGALVEGLWPSVRSATLALLTTALAGAAVLRRRPVPALAAAALFTLTGLSLAQDGYTRLQHAEVVTYSVGERVVVDAFAAGRYATVGEVGTEPRALERQVFPHRAALGARPGGGTVDSLTTGIPGLTAFRAPGGATWLVLPPTTHAFAKAAPAVDWVVVRGARTADPAALAAAFPNTRLVLPDRIPPWRLAAWAPFADRTHQLGRDGAWRVEAWRAGAPGE